MRMLELIAGAGETGLDPAGLRELNAEVGGLERHLGVRYTRVTRTGVTAEITVGPQHLQPVGLVNGGVFSALAESTGSLAGLAAAGGDPVVGVSNSTDFISPVRDGVIIAEATPVHLGRRTQLWQVDMRHDARLVARTTLRTMVLEQPA